MSSYYLSEDHKWTVLYYFADFELFATQYVLHISLLLLPNGIKLFETDSLLNISIHPYTGVLIPRHHLPSLLLLIFRKLLVDLTRRCWRLHLPVFAFPVVSQPTGEPLAQICYFLPVRKINRRSD